jgi:hypothetical protein
MTTVYNKFNRGEIDDLAVSREDVEKVRNTSTLMQNWLPMRLGPMKTRAGTEMLGPIPYAATYFVEFIRDLGDTALIELSPLAARLWVDDAVVSRTAVTTSWINGEFPVNTTGWTDNSGSGSSTAWNSAYSGSVKLSGNDDTSAVLYQTSVSTQTGAEHGFNIEIAGGPVQVQIGTDGLNSKDIFDGELGVGYHSLVFTPGADFTVTLTSNLTYDVYVKTAKIESAGDMVLPHSLSATDLSTARYVQSLDVVFLVARNTPQFKIERRGDKSWSLTQYRSDDGPFGKINDTDITLTAAALTGDTTLTSSLAYFTQNHIGALFKLSSESQSVSASVTAENNGTTGVLVTGVKKDDGRVINVNITGTFVATVTLQSSKDNTTWKDVKQYTSETITEYNDKLNNIELYYRLHIATGDFTSGTAELLLSFPNGTIDGVCRVTGFTDDQNVSVQVLKDFGSTDATKLWYEGQWSPVKGYPTAIELTEGRMFFAGPDIWGSESDEYERFGTITVGNAQAIYRTVGFGPVPNPYWLAGLNRMIMGIATDELNIRSDAYGVLLTNDNVNIKRGTNQGAANRQPQVIDGKLYYVQRSGIKIFEMMPDTNDRTEKVDLMTLHEAICSAGIKRIVFTRQPETRLWVLLDDGELRVYTFDRAEEQAAWSRVTTHTGHTFEDIIVLPAVNEDRVYVTVKRGGTLYLEKMALLSEARGGNDSKHYDSFVEYTSPGTATLTGLDHLNGETVYYWADGQERGSAEVSSGVIDIDSDSYTNIIVGLRVTSKWKSNKLRISSKYTNLTERIRVSRIGIIARNILLNNFSYGPSFDNLDNMPNIEEGTTVTKNTVQAEYDHQQFEFDGDYDTDSRICLEATGPATVMLLSYDLDEGEDHDT